jgi:hypothetical protein
MSTTTPTPTNVQQRGLYPASLLLSEMEKKKPACWVYTAHLDAERDKDSRWYKTFPATTDDTHCAVDHDATIMDRQKAKPVTVVFVTNASQFKIHHKPDDGGAAVSSMIDYGTFSENCLLFFGAGRTAHEKMSQVVE